MIAAGIHDDACQPSRKPRLALERVDLLDQGAADLLRNVLRIRVRPRQAPGDPMNAVVMKLQQGAKGVTIARDRALDEYAIGIANSFHGPKLAASRGLSCRRSAPPGLDGHWGFHYRIHEDTLRSRVI